VVEKCGCLDFFVGYDFKGLMWNNPKMVREEYQSNVSRGRGNGITDPLIGRGSSGNCRGDEGFGVYFNLNHAQN
jgi:hypothetical protein